MRNLKRFFCFFLVLAVLIPNALAVVIPGGGSNVSGTNSGTNTPFSMLYNTGIAIGIQQVSGDAYVVRQNTEAGRDSWSIKTEGFAATAKHFAYSYPDPYTNPSTGGGLLYILPNVGYEPKYKTATGASGVGQVPLDKWYYAGGGSMNHTLADIIYGAATANVNESNPNPRLPEGYFDGLLSKLDANSAYNLIVYIFGASSNKQVDANTIIKRFNEAYEYGVSSIPQGNTNGIKTRQICNYAAILLSLAKLLPSENHSVYEKYIGSFVNGALQGQSYSPVVITAELCMPFEHNGNKTYNTWRTVPEQIAIRTGASEKAIRNADTQLPASKSLIESQGSSLINPAAAIMRAAKANSSGTNRGSLGGIGMLGIDTQGNNVSGTYGAYCRNMTSISSATLNALKDNWKYNVPSTGLWGCGVFGVDDGLAPLKVIPPTGAADLTGIGEVSISAEPAQIVKEVGGYEVNWDVTVRVDLNPKFDASYEDVQNNIYWQRQGAGMASTMLWLHDMREAGFNFPDPYVEIYVSQSQGIDALGDSAVSSLTDKTYGYAANGIVSAPNSNNEYVSPRELETATGADFAWKQLNLSEYAAFRDIGVKGVKVEMMPTGNVRITFTDLEAAYNYFNLNSGVLTFKMSVPSNGTLEDETSKKQHWWKVGAGVSMYGPKDLTDMNSIAKTEVGLNSKPKYTYVSVVAEPEDQPHYYSTYQEPYSEFKQGTVPVSGGGSDEKFNSMTGTPTFTDTSGRTDFVGTPYEGAGRYYQYFASGGSEFVVQFDGKYHYNESATRNFEFNFSSVNCDQSTIPCSGHGHGCSSEQIGTTEDGAPIMGCTNPCQPTVHMSAHPHVISSSCSFSVTYNGLSYVEITNLKVWKLSEARLDGTRELLDTDEVFAEVKSTAPGISYNIAASNTAEQGRVVYEWMPKGTGEGGDRDNLVWNRTSSSSCSNAANENMGKRCSVCGKMSVSKYFVLENGFVLGPEQLRAKYPGLPIYDAQE